MKQVLTFMLVLGVLVVWIGYLIYHFVSKWG